MFGFYEEVEAKIFCILMLIFLYVFKVKSLQQQSKEEKFLYLFSFIEFAFSILAEITQRGILPKVCSTACIISSFFAMYFGYKCILGLVEGEETVFLKIMNVFFGGWLGLLAWATVGQEINLVGFILIFVIIALFVVEQYNKIRVDNLTKLYNRYGMDVELKEQLRQYEREPSDSFYIISCDLDNFKYINDTWGHAEGDRALVLIADVLSRVAKKFDSNVFRIGGDEFIIITDKSDEGLAETVTDTIKKGLDSIEFRDDFDIKMSLGISLYDGETSIDDLLNNADKKMYEAKRKEKATN